MLDGWRNQQLARNLKFKTIEQRKNTVRAFVAAANTYYPWHWHWHWHWQPQLVDEWLGDGRAVVQGERCLTRY
jgi:integrase/recombinase XerC